MAQLDNPNYTRWPNGEIPYEIQPNIYSQHDLDIIISAMRKIETQVGVECIRFVPRTTQTSWIKIIGDDSGCYSDVGMKKSGPQELRLSIFGCVDIGTAIHELLHALGFHHEQNRPDRDNFVKINYENIDPGKNFNLNF